MQTYRGDIVTFHVIDGTEREAIVTDVQDDGLADLVILCHGLDDIANFHDADSVLSFITRLDPGTEAGQWSRRDA